MTLVKRLEKGSALTWAENDGNLTHLESRIAALEGGRLLTLGTVAELQAYTQSAFNGQAVLVAEHNNLYRYDQASTRDNNGVELIVDDADRRWQLQPGGNIFEPFTLTVGSGGDFAHLHEAIYHLIDFRPTFDPIISNVSLVRIKPLLGYVVTQGVLLQSGFDLSWAIIHNDEIDDTKCDLADNDDLFCVMCGTAPIIAHVFDLQNTGNVGALAMLGGTIMFASIAGHTPNNAGGIKNSRDGVDSRLFYAYMGGKIHASCKPAGQARIVATGAQREAVFAYRDGVVDCTGCDLSNANQADGGWVTVAAGKGGIVKGGNVLIDGNQGAYNVRSSIGDPGLVILSADDVDIRSENKVNSPSGKGLIITNTPDDSPLALIGEDAGLPTWGGSAWPS